MAKKNYSISGTPQSDIFKIKNETIEVDLSVKPHTALMKIQRHPRTLKWDGEYYEGYGYTLFIGGDDSWLKFSSPKHDEDTEMFTATLDPEEPADGA